MAVASISKAFLSQSFFSQEKRAELSNFSLLFLGCKRRHHLLALSAIFPLVISSVFTQNKGGGGSPRSATDLLRDA